MFNKIFDFLFRKKPSVTPPKPINKQKILFIVKQRIIPDYDNKGGGATSTGLLTSAKMVVNLLSTFPNVDVNIVEVIDNNDIDREVTKYKPDIVIIEALWVIPEKFDILKKLHPKVKWVVRLHSDLPFLALEGVSFDWIPEYIKRGIFVASNSSRLHTELSYLYDKKFLTYLPNYYPLDPFKLKKIEPFKMIVNIGSFGAVRPMKNQLIQAVSAIRFAEMNGQVVHFHINGSRCEGRGDSVLRNLRSLFRSMPRHKLIEHPWYSHEDFKKMLSSTIDISMQVSLSETYNIVTADSINQGIPVVVSSEIPWVAKCYQADPNSSCDIIEKLQAAYYDGLNKKHKINYANLVEFNASVSDVWSKFLK